MRSFFLIILILFAALTNFSLADNVTAEEESCDNTMSTTTTLVVGATGATGKHVVQMLLDGGHKVRTVVRSKKRMESLLTGDYEDRLQVTEAALLDLSDEELEVLTRGCDAVVSCLGHTMDFKGIYGNPRKLVTNAVERLTTAIGENQKTKFILMGSNGVSNPNGDDDTRPFIERAILCLLRYMVPPVADNEMAALHLHQLGGTGPEWCVIRPDDLIDADVSKYELLVKPKFGLFGAGIATRSNVAHSMVELILNDEQWQKWKFQMPVLNDAVAEESTAE